MTIHRVQIRFQGVSELPEDLVTNTWHFDGTSGLDLANPMDMVEDFYTGGVGAGVVMGQFPSDRLTGEYEILVYDLSDPLPRVPVATRSGTGPVTGTNGLPSEVALVFSFQGTPEAGVPQARRRGRVFLGPFNDGTNVDGRPTNDIVTAVGAAGSALIAASDASINWKWGVFSPTNNDFVRVTNGWVDNEWDTVRSRGLRATTRAIVT